MRKRFNSGICKHFVYGIYLGIGFFLCTGPIIGTLLVEVAGSVRYLPAIGMLGFAVALSILLACLLFSHRGLKQCLAQAVGSIK
jgi:cytochrome c biogenesis protein CcdA